MKRSLLVRSFGPAGLLLCIMLSHSTVLSAQRLHGIVEGAARTPGRIVLLDTRGADHQVIDSVRPDARGSFDFRQRTYPAGFYQLALNDSDRVDIVLDPREKEVELRLSGVPLRANIAIVRSRENQLLWESKWLSRDSQARIASLRQEAATLSQGDVAGRRRIDSLEVAERADLQRAMDRLVEQGRGSHFAHVVSTDKALSLAATQGPMAVRDAFGWSDQRLVRSTIYPKAVMSYLQSQPSMDAGTFIAASDSILHWASRDTVCWRYARSLLVRLFIQYGPPEVADAVVERYVIGPGAMLPAEHALLQVSADVVRLTKGARAPDVLLPDPVNADTTRLSELLSRQRYTLLFFYSSTCDHCHGQMPGLKRIYDEWHDRGLEIAGIALDGDLAEFQQTITDRQLPWLSFSELRGWGSPAAKSYAVKTTPYFFLLDQRGVIVAKPLDHEDLRGMLYKLLP